MGRYVYVPTTTNGKTHYRVTYVRSGQSTPKGSTSSVTTAGSSISTTHHSVSHYNYSHPARRVNTRQEIPVEKIKIKTQTTHDTVTKKDYPKVTIKKVVEYISHKDREIRNRVAYEDQARREYHQQISNEMRSNVRKHPITGTVGAIGVMLNEREIATQRKIKAEAQNQKTKQLRQQEQQNVNKYNTELENVRNKVFKKYHLQNKVQNKYNYYIKQGLPENRAKSRAIHDVEISPEYTVTNRMINSLSRSNLQKSNKNLNKNAKLTNQEFKEYLKTHPIKSSIYKSARNDKLIKDVGVSFAVGSGTGEVFGGVVGGTSTAWRHLGVTKVASSRMAQGIIKVSGGVSKTAIIGSSLAVSSVIGWDYGKRVAKNIKNKNYFNVVHDTAVTTAGFVGAYTGGERAYKYTQQAKFQPYVVGKLNSDIKIRGKYTIRIETTAQ